MRLRRRLAAAASWLGKAKPQPDWTPAWIAAAQKRTRASAGAAGAAMARGSARRRSIALAAGSGLWILAIYATAAAMVAAIGCLAGAGILAAAGASWISGKSQRLRLLGDVASVAEAAVEASLEWCVAACGCAFFALGCAALWGLEASARAWALSPSLAPRSRAAFALGLNPLCVCACPGDGAGPGEGPGREDGLGRIRRMGLEGASEPRFARCAMEPVGLLGMFEFACWPWRSPKELIEAKLGGEGGPMSMATAEESEWLGFATACWEAEVLGASSSRAPAGSRARRL